MTQRHLSLYTIGHQLKYNHLKQLFKNNFLLLFPVNISHKGALLKKSQLQHKIFFAAFSTLLCASILPIRATLSSAEDRNIFMRSDWSLVFTNIVVCVATSHAHSRRYWNIFKLILQEWNMVYPHHKAYTKKNSFSVHTQFNTFTNHLSLMTVSCFLSLASSNVFIPRASNG